jgi:hypothetical protein
MHTYSHGKQSVTVPSKGVLAKCFMFNGQLLYCAKYFPHQEAGNAVQTVLQKLYIHTLLTNLMDQSPC